MFIFITKSINHINVALFNFTFFIIIIFWMQVVFIRLIDCDIWIILNSKNNFNINITIRWSWFRINWPSAEGFILIIRTFFAISALLAIIFEFGFSFGFFLNYFNNRFFLWCRWRNNYNLFLFLFFRLFRRFGWLLGWRNPFIIAIVSPILHLNRCIWNWISNSVYCTVCLSSKYESSFLEF